LPAWLVPPELATVLLRDPLRKRLRIDSGSLLPSLRGDPLKLRGDPLKLRGEAPCKSLSCSEMRRREN